MTRKRRWVVKAGSQLIKDGGPLLIRAWMKQVRDLQKNNIEVIWVTSGAIASARDRMSQTSKTKSKKNSLIEKQALSAIGQPIIMDLYNLSLQAVGALGAQILLTTQDLLSKDRLRNFKNSIEQLLKWGVIPVLNENDAVSTEEIRFGDNDALSARVAAAVGADLLVIMTDVDGLYDFDPRKNPKAKLVTKLETLSPALLNQLRKSATSQSGTGGMFSKVKAAQFAQLRGINTWLTRGDQSQALVDIFKGKGQGTLIPKKS